MTVPAKTDTALLGELRQLIEQARQHVAQMANSTLTMLYWRMGQRIGVKLLKEERAPYGQEIVSAASRELTQAYGKGLLCRGSNGYLTSPIAPATPPPPPRPPPAQRRSRP